MLTANANLDIGFFTHVSNDVNSLAHVVTPCAQHSLNMIPSDLTHQIRPMIPGVGYGEATNPVVNGG